MFNHKEIIMFLDKLKTTSCPTLAADELCGRINYLLIGAFVIRFAVVQGRALKCLIRRDPAAMLLTDYQRQFHRTIQPKGKYPAFPIWQRRFLEFNP